MVARAIAISKDISDQALDLVVVLSLLLLVLVTGGTAL